MSLRDKRVVVGLTGGIACYKACELVRLLVGEGASVRVVMTAGAQRFVAPLTLQALSGHPVGTDVFSCSEEAEIGHIRLADDADVVVVAPATADVLARMAHGIADDLLTTVLLATRAPVVVAPAMNVNMWEHPATQQNVETLRARGVTVAGPEVGELACGWEGAGRLSAPVDLVEVLAGVVGPGDLTHEHVLVSAGPTREALDPVRFLSNHSTGRMGYAVARAARGRGARVTLVTGPTELGPPAGVDVRRVTSAAEMAAELQDAFRSATVVVMAAAVADQRPATTAPRKVKKSAAGRSIRLVPTLDILAALGRRKGDRMLVGFAAETGDVLGEARRKLKAKRLDLIVANDVTTPGAGFAVDTNVVRLIDADGGDDSLPLMSKVDVAHRILDWVASRRRRPRDPTRQGDASRSRSRRARRAPG